MADIGAPASFDAATVLTGSGLTLLVSAAITRDGDQLSYTAAELSGLSGGVFVALGVLFGLASWRPAIADLTSR